MMQRVQELARQLQPLLGRRIDGLWKAYLAAPDVRERGEIEQTFELLAAKHLQRDYWPDRAPFPPPSEPFATSGDIRLGSVTYAGRALYPFALRSHRLTEHVLIAGRSGSGKTNLTFVLLCGLMKAGIRIVALDWKRGYRDLAETCPELKVLTIGRDVAPFRFNPLIPPPGCEPHVWIKLIVDVIAGAYLGGEGVISLLIAGLDHLFREYGAFGPAPTRWPTVQELLVWLRGTKLTGRAALWRASAERILLGMTYGEFGAVLNTQASAPVRQLLDKNVVLEMDGLSNAADRVLFSEALTLFLYRYRLAQGPRQQLTNVIILEEAHNLLLAKPPGTKESVLESSIRMIRQYGIGYVFVDQSASLLSNVAFANSYATIALSQKLRGDVQAIAGAMNLSDDQKAALSTLPVGTAVVRLADEHPEPFLIRVPRAPVREGVVSDDRIRNHDRGDSGDSAAVRSLEAQVSWNTGVPPPDIRNVQNSQIPYSHPPSPREQSDSFSVREPPPGSELSRDALRFLTDVAQRPLSTTVSRYQRLHFSRRRGDAVRRDLLTAGAIEAIHIATRGGQVVLHQLTDNGRALCRAVGIEPGPHRRASLEHDYWVMRAARHFERRGYDVTQEYAIQGDGFVDLLACRSGERVAIEIETGKSDVHTNVVNASRADFDEVVLLATNPAAVTACERALARVEGDQRAKVRLWTWLDLA